MHAPVLLQKLLRKALPDFHLKRLIALVNAADSLIRCKRLNISQLGKHVKGDCTNKNGIRKLDRLIGNKKIHAHIPEIYKARARIILSGLMNPSISVDWSTTSSHDNYCLRASVNAEGRSLTIYEEVHPRVKEKNNDIHNRFLDTLKAVLPEHCCPLIITDAGFRTPWFKKVESMGWHYLGRVRNNNNFYDSRTQTWGNTYELYNEANAKVQYIGKVLFPKSKQIESHMYLYKGKIKGRKRLNAYDKKSCQQAVSKAHSKSHREPFLIITSLPPEQCNGQKVIKLYQKRMEIEEEFRDIKDPKYGFGLKFSGTRNPVRLAMLLLIAAIATLLCWLISLALRKNNQSRHYQANTIRHRNVLSVITLACDAVCKHGQRLRLYKADFIQSIKQINTYCYEASYVNI